MVLRQQKPMFSARDRLRNVVSLLHQHGTEKATPEGAFDVAICVALLVALPTASHPAV